MSSKNLYQYLDIEIDKLEAKLDKFRATASYDSGYRMHCSESKLAGLHKARNLIRKAEREIIKKEKSL